MFDTTIPQPFAHPSFHGWIGIARADITPPVGVYSRNWGAAKHDIATSIHRPLTLTVLSLRSTTEGEPQILIDADLGWWKTPQIYQRFAEKLREKFSLRPEQIIFALSHTHAGPPLMDAEESIAGSELLETWKEQLFETTVNTIQDSLNSQEESILDWHHGRCNLATVRDFPDPSGERYLCGYNPDEPADDTLIVGRVSSVSGGLRATLTNYACHPTTLAWENTAISPDYPGAMRDTIQQVTGVPAMFLLGACGELAPRYQYVGDTEVADQHGRQLAFATLSVLEDMEPAGQSLQFSGPVESGAPLAVWRHQSSDLNSELRATEKYVELPIKDWPSADELEEQRLACTDRTLEERLLRKRNVRRGVGDQSTYDLPVYAWRFGNAVLVGCRCEPYSTLQKQLRNLFPDVTVICMNLINGTVGYLPPEDLYDTDIYPVWQTPFDRGSLELTIKKMTEAIEDVLQ